MFLSLHVMCHVLYSFTEALEKRALGKSSRFAPERKFFLLVLIFNHFHERVSLDSWSSAF